jgi:hypothetical protein
LAVSPNIIYFDYTIAVGIRGLDIEISVAVDNVVVNDHNVATWPLLFLHSCGLFTPLSGLLLFPGFLLRLPGLLLRFSGCLLRLPYFLIRLLL